MFPDPLLLWLKEIGFSWWLLWMTAAFASMSLSWILLKVSKTHYDDAGERRLDQVIWPWLILGPVVAAYLIIADMGERISTGLVSVGYFYEDYSLLGNSNIQVSYCILLFSMLFTVLVTLRFIKVGKPKWLVKPRKTIIARGLLINLPMTVMAIATVARLLDHWAVLYRFSLLGWRPGLYYSADGMYGLGWSYTVILTESIVALLLSLAPLLMLLRDTDKNYSKLYLVLTFAGLIYLGSYFLILIPGFDRFFKEINAHFLKETIGSFSQYLDIAELDSMERIFQEMILARRIDDINKLPSDFGINLVRILGSVFTLRFAGFIFQIMGPQSVTQLRKYLASRLTGSSRKKSERSRLFE